MEGVRNQLRRSSLWGGSPFISPMPTAAATLLTVASASFAKQTLRAPLHARRAEAPVAIFSGGNDEECDVNLYTCNSDGALSLEDRNNKPWWRQQDHVDEMKLSWQDYGSAGIVSLIAETVMFWLFFLLPAAVALYHHQTGHFVPALADRDAVAEFGSTLGACYLFCKLCIPIEAARVSCLLS